LNWGHIPYLGFKIREPNTVHLRHTPSRSCCFSLCKLHHTPPHHCATVHHNHHCAPPKVVTALCHFVATLWLYVNGAGRWVRSSEFVFVAEKNEVLCNSGVAAVMILCGYFDEGSKVLLWRNSGSFQRLTRALGFHVGGRWFVFFCSWCRGGSSTIWISLALKIETVQWSLVIRVSNSGEVHCGGVHGEAMVARFATTNGGEVRYGESLKI